MVRARTAAVLAVALVLAGSGFDSPSLIVPGVGLGLLAVAFFIWVEAARPRKLVREPGPSRIVEGEVYRLRIAARGGLLRPPDGDLDDSMLTERVAIGPRWRGRLAVDLTVEGRGRRELAPATLVVRDPLGLHARRIESEPPSPLLVLPRIEPVLAAGAGRGGGRRSVLAGLEDGARSERLDVTAIELEVDGLRPHRPGSPASRIHWPAVARTGEMLERRLVAGGDAAPLIVLDASQPDDDGALDAAVRAAASICFHLGRAGGCAALLAGERRPLELDGDLHAWPAIHARFALAEATAVPPPVSRAVRRGAVFWVAARSVAAIPRALVATSSARYLVIPGASRERAAVAFSVAGCTGIRVGRRIAAPARRAA